MVDTISSFRGFTKQWYMYDFDWKEITIAGGITCQLPGGHFGIMISMGEGGVLEVSIHRQFLRAHPPVPVS